MVTRAARDYSRFFGIAQLGKFVHAATNFERTGALQVLSLEQNGSAEALAEIGRGQNGSMEHYIFAAFTSRFKIS